MIHREHALDKGKSSKKLFLLIVFTNLALAAAACSSPAPPAPASSQSPPAPTSIVSPVAEPVSPTPAGSPTVPAKPAPPSPGASAKPQPPGSPATPTATPWPVTPPPSPSPKPTPTGIAPPPLTPAPTPVYIYTENFTKPGGWYTKSSVPDKYDAGYPAAGQPPGYYLTIKVSGYGVYMLDKTFGDAKDFTIQVDCTALTDLPGWYGIAFRMDLQTNDHYEYAVAHLTGAYCLSKTVGGKRTLLIPWTASPLLKKGANQANRLMMEARGSEFTIYANGYYLNRFTDSTDSLRMGVLRIFGISGDKPDVRFVFNDFRMKGD